VPDVLSSVEVLKADETLGLVFGFAIVCKENGQDHYDLQDHHIPEDVMLEAATDFAVNSRVAKDMHGKSDRGDDITGEIAFMFPLTGEIAKTFGLPDPPKTGLMIAMKPDAALLAKFVSGEYKGFSIGGVGNLEEVA
jgi:hypothetical protein